MRALWVSLVFLLLGLWPSSALAAVGCSLNNPDEDIRRFFPKMTSYRVHYVSFKTQNPQGHQALSAALGTPLDPVFEASDVPYSLYIVEGETSRLGFVFGANNRGAHSSIQVIAALDVTGEVREIYLQRIRSPEAAQFRSTNFLEELSSHPLEAFSGEQNCYRDAQCSDALVADPSAGRASQDYRAILRGLAKLHWLREHLLFPLADPAPQTLAAQAEWIGNHRGSDFSLKSSTPLLPFRPEANDFEPDTEVFVWGAGAHALVWPMSALQSYATLSTTVGNHTLVLARASRGGNPVLLRLPQGSAIRPTRDVLWEDQIYLDSATASRWSLSLNQAIYGPASGRAFQRLKAGIALRWEEAQTLGLQLLALSPEPLEPTLRSANPTYLVVHSQEGPLAWAMAHLRPEELVEHADLLIARIGDDALVWSTHDTNGRAHEFTRPSTFYLEDEATHSQWSLISGRALSGPLSGAQLRPVLSNRVSEEGLRGLFPLAQQALQKSTTDSP